MLLPQSLEGCYAADTCNRSTPARNNPQATLAEISFGSQWYGSDVIEHTSKIVIENFRNEMINKPAYPHYTLIQTPSNKLIFSPLKENYAKVG